jgi:hypothetical protein
MKPAFRLFFPLAMIAMLTAFHGCIFSPDVDDPKITVEYKTQTSPENVVHNLKASYVLRDIDEYAKLLAPEFIFKFQPVDAQEIAKEFWTRDEDSLGTNALFKATIVTSITIDLVHGDAEDANDLELPANAKKIRINQTFLQVDETTGITWVVSDLQDMFFRPGDATLGEDENLWFLIEWRDIPSTAAPGIRTDPLGAGSVTSTRLPSSWGAMKARPLADE